MPAGVGVMLHWHHVGNEWIPIGVCCWQAPLSPLAVTALTMKLMMLLFR
ncbi:MAG: hypothetical protein R3F37_11620 [Candidatus Competibacteraceae bacterium]